MSISYVGISGSAIGVDSLVFTYPGGIAAGDLLVLAISNKYPTNGPTTPSGWTAPTNNQRSGGAGSNGENTGSVYSTVYVKVATGDESGYLSVSIPSGNCAVGRLLAYRKSGSSWLWAWACTNGVDNIPGTSWSAQGAADPGVTAGDWVVVCSAINSTEHYYVSHAVSQAGITWGASTERADSAVSYNDNCDVVVSDHVAASGNSSGLPTFTMTAWPGATYSPAGASVFLRIREIQIGFFGTAAISGGGSVALAALKGGLAAPSVHGNGTIALAGVAGARKAILLHGGGTAVAQGWRGANVVAHLSGSGVLIVAHARAGGNFHYAYLPGGGRAITQGAKGARGTAAVHGRGNLVAVGVRFYAGIASRTPEKYAPIRLVYLQMDYCGNVFGVEPCLATGTPCFNTWKTCKYLPAFLNIGRTYKYSEVDAALPFAGVRPYVKAVRLLPTEIKTNVTVNARVSVVMVDELDQDIDTDPYLVVPSLRAVTVRSYWKRFLSRNPNYKGRLLEIYEGQIGIAEGEFRRTWVGKLTNVTMQNGEVTFESTDLLKDLSLIDVPPKLDIKLAADLSAVETGQITLTGVEGLEPSGYIRIKDEIIGYDALVPNAKALRMITRGAFGTTPAAYSARDKVQKVRYFAPSNPWDILLTMLREDAGIADADIDFDAFERGKRTPGNDLLFRAVISEPEKLDKLFFEITDLLDAKAWVAEDLRITVRRNLPNAPGRAYYRITDEANIVDGSASVDLNEKSRLTRMLIYWHKNVLGKKDVPAAYDRLDIAVDADAEAAYGDVVEKKFFCRWIDPMTNEEDAAGRYIKNLGMRQVRRCRDAQPLVSLSLSLRDLSLKTGEYVRLTTDELVRFSGDPIENEIFQVVKRELFDDFSVKMSLLKVSTRRLALIAPSGYPNYLGATDAQREYGFITLPTGLMENEDEGYFIW